MRNLLKTRLRPPAIQSRTANPNLSLFEISEAPADRSSSPAKTLIREVLSPKSRQNTPQITHFSWLVKPRFLSCSSDDMILIDALLLKRLRHLLI